MIPCPLKKPRWARRKDARPQELLAAALDLFVERGFAATRLDDVAARAGVSKGTLYLYFANKEELFKAAVRETVLPVLGEAEDIVDSYEGTTTDLFRDIVFGWWERVGPTRIGGISKLMLAESNNFPELAAFYRDEVVARADAMIGRLLERGINRGEFRQVDIPHATTVLCAPMMMLMLSQHSYNCQIHKVAPQQYLATFIDLFLNGLRQDSPIP